MSEPRKMCVLTAEQWEVERENAARAMHDADVERHISLTMRQGFDWSWGAATGAAQESWLTSAEAAMTALGFRRDIEEAGD